MAEATFAAAWLKWCKHKLKATAVRAKRLAATTRRLLAIDISFTSEQGAILLLL